jgi:hypothetical protein
MYKGRENGVERVGEGCFSEYTFYNFDFGCLCSTYSKIKLNQ